MVKDFNRLSILRLKLQTNLRLITEYASNSMENPLSSIIVFRQAGVG